ncbi:hypothetical protein RND81_13G071900 [Saponaria officinalis]|uniref:B3 domain-containing protein n=1 Tax=Saponaria officinalis TaxID=3572 RepID=A0AAW1GUZ1_SAPOF
MMDFLSLLDFKEDEIKKIECLSPLDMLAIVAEKALLKDYPPAIDMSMSEKKKLPFGLNSKIRTIRIIRSAAPTNSEEGGSSQPPPPKKRRLVAPPLPQPLHPELPVEYRQKIAEMGGSDVQFVMQKRLYDADVSTEKSRLTMPCRQCRINFGKVGKTQVMLIHKDGNKLREMMMTFFRWDTVSSYVFNGSWNNLVEVNGLKTDDVV